MARRSRVVGGTGQAHEGGVDVCRAGVCDDARDLALRQHPALMQHHEVVARLISSNRCVAQSTPMPCSVTSWRTWLKMSARALTSSPTVASSSSSSRGRCSSARAISSRRIWPPERSRTLLPARSARPMRVEHLAAAQAAPRAWRCRAGRRDRAGSASPRGRDRACAAGTRRRAGAALRLARVPMSWPKMPIAAVLDAEQPRHQREQRALAGAVQPEQRRKTAPARRRS